MKKTILLFLFISIIATINAQNIVGKWSGTLDIMGQDLPIVFNISHKDDIYKAKMDSPAQNAFGLPTDKTTFDNNNIEIIANGLGIIYKGILESDSIRGTFNQGGVAFPLILKQEEITSRLRPQTPTPPFPYKIEEIAFHNKKDDIYLSGTITTPDTIGTFPAVVLVAGSGANDRDETIFEHKPLWVIADYLTRNGFMVLRYDKRGVGSSTGKYDSATTLDFAEDAKEAINYLKSRDDVDKSSIGIIGHSEGGIIAPMIASENKDIKFIVLLSGMGTKGIDLIVDQNEISLNAQNIEPNNIKELLKTNREMFESLNDWEGNENDKTKLRDYINIVWNKTPLIVRLKMNKDQFIRTNINAMASPWFRYFLTINPEEYLQKTNCAVLAINGDKDTQVLAAKNLSIIKSSLTKGGNNNFDIKIYPNLNHLFQQCETGYVDEYINIEQTIDEQVLIDIKNWIQEKIKE